MPASRVCHTAFTLLPTLMLSFIVLGCGAATKPPAPAAEPATTATVGADISSDPAVREFFARLGASGEDLQSDFGGALVTIGMNPRDLEQDDPKHAYDTVMEKVRKIEDPTLRREMLRTFFNISEAP